MNVPRAAVTADNRGPSINIVAWVTLIAVCLATCTKIGVKYSNVHRFEWDDAYMLGAMVGRILFHCPDSAKLHASKCQLTRSE